jgi:hypothetical protein
MRFESLYYTVVLWLSSWHVKPNENLKKERELHLRFIYSHIICN